MAYSPPLGDTLAAQWIDGVHKVASKMIQASGLSPKRARMHQAYRYVVKTVFEGISSASIDGEGGYSSLDWDAAIVRPAADPRDDDISAYFDIVSSYETPPKSLTEEFWTELEIAVRAVPEQFGLIISERPFSFRAEGRIGGTDGRAVLRVVQNSPWEGINDVPVALVDVSQSDDHLADDLTAIRELFDKSIDSGILSWNPPKIELPKSR